MASSYADGGGGGSGSPYAALVQASSPLLYWRLGESSGTTAIDSSGNGRDGTYSFAPSATYIPLVIEDDNSSIYFDGNSQTQHASAASAGWMNVPEMTIAFTCFPDPGALGLQMLASRYMDSTTDTSFFVCIDSKEFKFYYRGSGGQEVTISSGFMAEHGQTYYVAAYCGASGAGLRIYHLGVLVSSTTGAGYTLNSSGRSFTVGGSDQPAAYHVYGWMQEISYFGSILSTGTIDSLAALATTPQPSWINRTSGVAARNGTSDHTISFTPASAGSLLVAVVNGAVTHTAVTPGWTKRLAPVDYTELAVFTRSANAGDSSLQVTHNGSNHPINYVVYEFPSGSSYVTGAGNNIGNTPPISGLPGTAVVVFGAVSQASITPADPTVTMEWGYGWIEDTDVMTPSDGVTDGAHLGIGYITNVKRTSINPETEGFYGPVWDVSNVIVGITGATFAIAYP